jgi:hypothetical protein
MKVAILQFSFFNSHFLSFAMVLPALFSVIALMGAAGAAVPKPQSLADRSAATEMTFGYKYEGPRFWIRSIEVDINSNGIGEMRFLRGESDEVLDCKVKLLPATVSRIRRLFEASRFLTSDAEYQDERDFSHLGWTTLIVKQGGRERKARFNYTKNQEIKELEEIFRGIADQEIALFDIENAERYQPLDLPKQLEALENDLNLARITEPERLLGKLNEIVGDDTLPLIARNHARRIIEAIKKGKFKTPMKK